MKALSRLLCMLIFIAGTVRCTAQFETNFFHEKCKISAAVPTANAGIAALPIQKESFAFANLFAFQSEDKFSSITNTQADEALARNTNAQADKVTTAHHFTSVLLHTYTK